VWLMPNMYHVDSSGNLAPGCRAVEALKLLYTLHDLFGNAIYARERLRQDAVASKVVKPAAERFPPSQEQIRENRVAFARAEGRAQELRQAERNYVRQHGTKAYDKLVREMVEGVLP